MGEVRENQREKVKEERENGNLGFVKQRKIKEKLWEVDERERKPLTVADQGVFEGGIRKYRENLREEEKVPFGGLQREKYGENYEGCIYVRGEG